MLVGDRTADVGDVSGPYARYRSVKPGGNGSPLMLAPPGCRVDDGLRSDRFAVGAEEGTDLVLIRPECYETSPT